MTCDAAAPGPRLQVLGRDLDVGGEDLAAHLDRGVLGDDAQLPDPGGWVVSHEAPSKSRVSHRQAGARRPAGS